MAQIIAGPGLLLPYPQALYPASLYNSPYTAPTNTVELGAGNAINLPAGQWYCMGGTSSAPQFLDPVSQQWRNMFAPGTAWGVTLKSDGFNLRIANTTDTAYANYNTNGGIVTAAGSGYVQATTAITVSAGNSTWQPVVGGKLGSFTVASGGSGYTVPPLVFIPAPPYPGVCATAHSTLSAGAVSSVTLDQAGAGYLTAPPVILIPSPLEPASSNIVNASVTVVLAGAGTLTAVLLINFGTPQTSAPTLTVTGAGSSATATTNPSTVTSAASDIITIQPAVGP